jgi:lipopolysaccharide biosynthesis protein
MTESPRVIAFFLPQFHSIPENDTWWGDGFTDWTNTRKATPVFEGHHQPRIPLGGRYFDLTNTSELVAQSDLAREYGIDAFCFHYYWFQGQRLLEKPLDLYSELSETIPFCLSWANENWTRRWDGKKSEKLVEQEYKDETPVEIYNDFRRYFFNENYLRIDGKPVFLVHRVTDLPDPGRVARQWRSLAKQDGWPDLYLIASETTPGLNPYQIGFDATVEFPPVGKNTVRNALLRPPRGLSRQFAGRLLSYPKLAQYHERRPEPAFNRHRGVMPGWDNSARRGLLATIYVDHSPERYMHWLETAIAHERRVRGERGLVFVNAWNEWAEGAYLQPDTVNGMAYLEATRMAVGMNGTQRLMSDSIPIVRRTWRPSSAIVHSVAGTLGSSLLRAVRIMRSQLRQP